MPGRARPGRLSEALGLDSSGDFAVLDPLPLTRSVLERAVSGAVTLLRSGGMITRETLV
jgi:hypothetical protein